MKKMLLVLFIMFIVSFSIYGYNQMSKKSNQNINEYNALSIDSTDSYKDFIAI